MGIARFSTLFKKFFKYGRAGNVVYFKLHHAAVRLPADYSVWSLIYRKRTRNKAKTKYTGAYATSFGKWVARIKIGNENRIIGTYKTAKEAAKAYDQECYAYFGDDAVLNFPKDWINNEQAKAKKPKDKA